MTGRRIATGGAVLALGLVAGAVWAAAGTGGLLWVLTALVIVTLAVNGAVLVRAERVARAMRSTAREVAAIRASLAEADLPAMRASLAGIDLAPVRESLAELADFLRREEQAGAEEPDLELLLDGVYAQVEGLLSLHSTLRPQRPLPPLRGWAVSPDFMARAVTILLGERPATIVECGSGASTVFLALALRCAGGGRIVSLEHKERFAEETRALLTEHGLGDVATVRFAPLEPVAIGETEWRWYEPSALEGVDRCGLVVVDGPPRTIGPLARYPVLPLLRDRLRPGAVILMDDYRRDSEQRTVRRWRQEYPELRLRVHEHEKRTAELRLPAG